MMPIPTGVRNSISASIAISVGTEHHHPNITRVFLRITLKIGAEKAAFRTRSNGVAGPLTAALWCNASIFVRLDDQSQSLDTGHPDRLARRDLTRRTCAPELAANEHHPFGRYRRLRFALQSHHSRIARDDFGSTGANRESHHCNHDQPEWDHHRQHQAERQPHFGIRDVDQYQRSDYRGNDPADTENAESLHLGLEHEEHDRGE